MVMGIVFSMVKDFHFDFKNKKYKIVKRVGPIGFGSWKNFEQLNYLSVYENLDGLYELKLWYNKIRHYSIDIYRSKTNAIEAGKELAKNLSIDLYTPKMDYTFKSDVAEPIEISEEERTIDAHLSEGTRPLWQLLIAALFFTAALVSLYIFYATMRIDEVNKQFIAYFEILQITGILFVAGTGFSVVRDYQFDFKNKQYKIIDRIGPLKYGQWKVFKSLDYISVFKKGETKYLVNLWYNTNKHHNFYIHDNANTALEIGKELAKKLKIDLLDATDPHKSKWVDT